METTGAKKPDGREGMVWQPAYAMKGKLVPGRWLAKRGSVSDCVLWFHAVEELRPPPSHVLKYSGYAYLFNEALISSAILQSSRFERMLQSQWQFRVSARSCSRWPCVCTSCL